MARPPAAVQLTHTISEPPLSVVGKSLLSPTEITEQLARVDALHIQLKAETIRAQEFLLKLRQEEIDALSQIQSKSSGRTSQQQDELAKNHNHHPKDKKEQPRLNKKGSAKGPNGTHSHEALHTATRGSTSATGGASKAKSQKDNSCRCGCPHHPLSPESEAQLKKLADHYNVPTSLNTHVDEREVRDLEKRVRGLEGRVRGFEGLPPDREMALLEVERLRRELEGLARRREGLFEGLSEHLAEHESAKRGGKSVTQSSGKAMGNRPSNSRVTSNGKVVGSGKK